MVSILLFALLLGQDSIPYKSSDEFEIKLDYQFKPRPTPNAYNVKFEESASDYSKRTSSTPLPYLTLNLEILKASSEEVRVKGFRNGKLFLNKRDVKSGTHVEIEMGYTDDMKDRVTPHEYILILSNNDKIEISRIVIFIGEDGAFLVNGEIRGQF